MCGTFITMDVSPISQEVKGARPTDSVKDPESANSELASIQTYAVYMPVKCRSMQAELCMFKRPWALTQNTTV